MAEVASFVVVLERDRAGRLSLRLDQTGTLKRDGDFAIDCYDGSAGAYAEWLAKKYPAEYARAKAVHDAFARLLRNIDEDLKVHQTRRAPYCSCAPDDSCPAHALMDALRRARKGKGVGR